MLAEINHAKDYLIRKFGSAENVKPGTYSIPTETSKGPAFMKVVINEKTQMSDFNLYKDEELMVSWYN